MIMDKEQNIKDMIADLERIQSNPIYFINEYWNKVHPDQKLELTDEEKEVIFKNHRVSVPFFTNGEGMHGFMERYREAQKQGLKDWQIFYPTK